VPFALKKLIFDITGARSKSANGEGGSILREKFGYTPGPGAG